MKWVKTGYDVNEVLEEHNQEWDKNGDGDNEWETPRGSGRITWNDEDTFSVPMQHFFNGVLKTFLVFAFIAGVIFATWMTM